MSKLLKIVVIFNIFLVVIVAGLFGYYSFEKKRQNLSSSTKERQVGLETQNRQGEEGGKDFQKVGKIGSIEAGKMEINFNDGSSTTINLPSKFFYICKNKDKETYSALQLDSSIVNSDLFVGKEDLEKSLKKDDEVEVYLYEFNNETLLKGIVSLGC